MASEQSGSFGSIERIKEVLREVEELKECDDVIHAIVEYIDWLRFFEPRAGHKILLSGSTSKHGVTPQDCYEIELIMQPNNKCDLWFKHYKDEWTGVYEPIAENIDFVAEYSANYQMIRFGGDNGELQKHFAHIKQKMGSEKFCGLPSTMFETEHMDWMKRCIYLKEDWEYIGWMNQFGNREWGHTYWSMSTHKDDDLKQMQEEEVKQTKEAASNHEAAMEEWMNSNQDVDCIIC